MAIVVPIISEWNPQGLDRSMADLQRAEGGWAKFGKGVQMAAAPAGLALVGLGAAGMKAVSAAEEAAQANARLSKVFDSMGYEQNTQAALDYADSLSKTIGVDDEIIKGAQAKLATFSEVAKSTEQMARTTSLAADLSAAGFGSMDSAAVMLGKAVQDPIKGLTAMSRVGVTFTAQQQEQIKALVEGGKAAKAQGIILKAVETQVGGVAEAAATGSAKMSVAFGEVWESVGAALLPAFEALLPYVQQFATWASENGKVIAAVGVVVAALATGILALAGAMKALAIIKSVIALVKGLNLALLTSPWFWVIAAVVLLAVVIWKNWDKIKAWTSALFGWMKGFVIGVWESLKSAATTVFEGIKNVVGTVWEWIKWLFLHTNPIGIIINNLDTLKAAWGAAWDWIGDKVEAAWSFVQGILDKIQGAMGSVVGVLDKIPGVDLSVAGEGTTSLMGGVPLGSVTRGAASAGGGTVVNVYGAVDPESTARQVKRILESHDVRQGNAPGTATAVAW